MGDSDIPHGRRGRGWNSVSVKNALGGGGGGRKRKSKKSRGGGGGEEEVIASDKVQRRLGDISWSIKNGGFYIN